MLKHKDDLQALSSDKSLKKFPFNEQLLQLCTECWQRYKAQFKKYKTKLEKDKAKLEKDYAQTDNANNTQEGHMLDLKLQVNI
jgi:hypothetical protein